MSPKGIFHQNFSAKMTLDVIEGLVACAISSTFFGSMFVPLKKFDVGDGTFLFFEVSYLKNWSSKFISSLCAITLCIFRLSIRNKFWIIFKLKLTGIFAQWVTGTAIFMFGMIVSAARGFPAFQPFAMLGGIFWAIGEFFKASLKIFSLKSIILQKYVWIFIINGCLGENKYWREFVR